MRRINFYLPFISCLLLISVPYCQMQTGTGTIETTTSDYNITNTATEYGATNTTETAATNLPTMETTIPSSNATTRPADDEVTNTTTVGDFTNTTTNYDVTSKAATETTNLPTMETTTPSSNATTRPADDEVTNTTTVDDFTNTSTATQSSSSSSSPSSSTATAAATTTTTTTTTTSTPIPPIRDPDLDGITSDIFLSVRFYSNYSEELNYSSTPEYLLLMNDVQDVLRDIYFTAEVPGFQGVIQVAKFSSGSVIADYYVRLAASVTFSNFSIVEDAILQRVNPLLSNATIGGSGVDGDYLMNVTESDLFQARNEVVAQKNATCPKEGSEICAPSEYCLIDNSTGIMTCNYKCSDDQSGCSDNQHCTLNADQEVDCRCDSYYVYVAWGDCVHEGWIIGLSCVAATLVLAILIGVIVNMKINNDKLKSEKAKDADYNLNSIDNDGLETSSNVVMLTSESAAVAPQAITSSAAPPIIGSTPPANGTGPPTAAPIQYATTAFDTSTSFTNLAYENDLANVAATFQPQFDKIDISAVQNTTFVRPTFNI